MNMCESTLPQLPAPQKEKKFRNAGKPKRDKGHYSFRLLKLTITSQIVMWIT